MEIWPNTLPQRLNRGSLKYKLAKNSQATPMERGPPKRRRVTSSNIQPLSGTIIVTTEQWDILENFFKHTVREVEVFLFPHPVTGNLVAVTFAGEPDLADYLPGKWIVSLVLEEQP